ncbi:MAG: hypothetical protein ABEN55_23250 [Bradymonadaceae bacterium]
MAVGILGIAGTLIGTVLDPVAVVVRVRTAVLVLEPVRILRVRDTVVAAVDDAVAVLVASPKRIVE